MRCSRWLLKRFTGRSYFQWKNGESNEPVFSPAGRQSSFVAKWRQRTLVFFGPEPKTTSFTYHFRCAESINERENAATNQIDCVDWIKKKFESRADSFKRNS